MKSRLPRVVWFLTALLLIGAVLLKFGETADQNYVGASGVGAAGTAGLVNLMRAMGFRDVNATQNSMADMKPGTVRIDPVPGSRKGWNGEQEKAADVASEQAATFVRNGGKLINLNFPATPGAAQTTPVKWSFGDPDSTDQITLNPETDSGLGGSQDFSGSERRTIPIAKISSGDLMTLSKVGKGMLLDVSNATFMNNENLAKASNAEVLAKALSMMAVNKDTPILVSEATAGHGEAPSIIEALGPAFLSAWRQLLLTCLVIAYALGRRFGLPDRRRVTERGGRELVDAVAGLLKRSHRAQFAAEEEMRRLDNRVRREFNIDNRMTVKERDKVLPKHIAEILNSTENKVDQSRDAALLAERLNSANKEADRVLHELRH